MVEILKVLVGSRAHGIFDEDSDYDYRAVFIEPTSQHLKIGGKVKNTSWIEGDNDNTAWEIGHFLQLATRCNPTILEVFHAEVIPKTLLNTEYGKLVGIHSTGAELKELFPLIWNTKDVVNSHIRYGLNQRKKFLEDKDGRKSKYACAYLRTLYQAYRLLTKNDYPVSMVDTPVYDTLVRYRAGDYEYGEVIDTCLHWQKKIENLEAARCQKETDIDAVNKFLLQVRRDNW